MDQIELIWKLEEINIALRRLNKELKKYNENDDNSSMDKDIDIHKMNLQVLDDNIKSINKGIRINENNIKDMTFNKNQIDDELYSGSITDLSQLEHLGSEKTSLKTRIDKLETETLSLMEDLSDLEDKYNKAENGFKELESKFLNMEEDNLRIQKDLEKEIEEKEKNKKELEKKIDKDKLKIYDELRRTKIMGISKIKDSICKGCNMRVSAMTWDKAQFSDELVYCENCNRILYYSEE